MYSTSERAKRLEFRTPDPSANPYYAFPAMMMAGLDGIRNQIEPPKPIDKNLYELEPEEAAKVKSMPGSLDQALDALEKDHELPAPRGCVYQGRDRDLAGVQEKE